MILIITIIAFLAAATAQGESPRDIYEAALKNILNDLQKNIQQHQLTLSHTLALAD